MPKRNIIWMLVVVAVAVGTAWLMTRSPQARRESLVRADALVEAYRIIAENHCPPVDPLELRRSGVEGMVKSLDPQSRYVPYDRAVTFKRRMLGRASGTGLVMDLSDRGPVVGCVYPGSPADKAGLVAGDVIVLLNSRPAFNMGLEQVRQSLACKPDEKVRLRVMSGSRTGAPRDVVLRPGEYAVETVTGLYRDPSRRWVYMVDRNEGLAYIRIEEFVEGTVERFRDAFRRPSLVRGLVLDLRGNPGGLLGEGVELANLFLHDGPILMVLRNGGKVERHTAHPEGTYPEIPVVVLVDAATASAAEIVAGSLNRADRAVLIGEPTRGKHSVQSMFSLSGKLGLLHLTTARFFFEPELPAPATQSAEVVLPRSAGKPIGPHVPIAVDPKNRRELIRLRWRAASAGVQPTTAPATQPAGGSGRGVGRELMRLDAPLARAVELLKNPAEIRAILKASAEARRRRAMDAAAAATRPAGGAKTTP